MSFTPKFSISLSIASSLTIQTYERLYPDVNRRTLQRDLQDLIEKGLLSLEGSKKTAIYMLKDDK